MYRAALSNASYVFFQNPSDRKLFCDEKLVDPHKCKLTPGSGIDLKNYEIDNTQSSEKEFSFLLIARLVWDKGIREFIEASRLIKEEYPKTKFKIIGPSGVENRSAISSLEIKEWKKQNIVEYFGEVEDVRNISEIHLASYYLHTEKEHQGFYWKLQHWEGQLLHRMFQVVKRLF